MNRLFIFIFILSPFVYSDNENICFTNVFYNSDEYSTQQISRQIKEQRCKKDNIFQVAIMDDKSRDTMPIKDELSSFAMYWCRFDREILIEGYTLTCALNSIKMRTWNQLS